MNFKVGDYVRIRRSTAYMSRAMQWLVYYKVKPSLCEKWSSGAPKVGTKGTIVFVAPLRFPGWEDLCGYETGYYFLDDNGKGFLLDESNLER